MVRQTSDKSREDFSRISILFFQKEIDVQYFKESSHFETLGKSLTVKSECIFNNLIPLRHFHIPWDDDRTDMQGNGCCWKWQGIKLCWLISNKSVISTQCTYFCIFCGTDMLIHHFQPKTYHDIFIRFYKPKFFF